MNEKQLLSAYALTLKNPWAHLIAHGGKTVENRSWMPHAGVDWLLIHAGKGWDHSADFGSFYVGDVQVSAIVATASLLFACDSSLNSDTVVCGCGEWAMPRQCHWRLGGVRALHDPVPCDGKQGLWRPSGDVIARIERQLVPQSFAVSVHTHHTQED